MIIAYVTICIMQMQYCAPETPAPMFGPFNNDNECWMAIDDFMEHSFKNTNGVVVHWRCGSDA